MTKLVLEDPLLLIQDERHSNDTQPRLSWLFAFSNFAQNWCDVYTLEMGSDIHDTVRVSVISSQDTKRK